MSVRPGLLALCISTLFHFSSPAFAAGTQCQHAREITDLAKLVLVPAALYYDFDQLAK